MKKTSTPSFRLRFEVGSQSDNVIEPAASTLDFIRKFARSCRALPVRSIDSKLSVIVLN